MNSIFMPNKALEAAIGNRKSSMGSDQLDWMIQIRGLGFIPWFNFLNQYIEIENLKFEANIHIFLSPLSKF